MLRSIIKNRQLIVQMAKRDVIGRYRGSVLGLAWSFFNPLIMLAVYTFVFSVVFQSRWTTTSNSQTEFALALFVGMITHGLLAECVGRAPSIILSHVSYVKKVVFPLEILPWVAMGGTLFHSLISLCVWALFFVVVNQSLHWTVVFIPLVLLPLVLFTMGLAWVLAALGVYLRDIGQMTGVFTMILMFLSPVFYSADRLPEKFKIAMYLNPLTFIIEQARDVLMWGKLPNWNGLAIAIIISFIVAWLGFVVFQRTRQGFADVL
ncbi:MAG: ABC transporter permease [Methylococcaceae bacterium]|nr:ABC transporter permease [Methylococcaceae bacterium]